MDNQPTPEIAQVAPSPTPIINQAPAPVPEQYSHGGFFDKIGEFKLVEYFTFALFISASIYSIYYHRQALNKLNEDTF